MRIQKGLKKQNGRKNPHSAWDPVLENQEEAEGGGTRRRPLPELRSVNEQVRSLGMMPAPWAPGDEVCREVWECEGGTPHSPAPHPEATLWTAGLPEPPGWLPKYTCLSHLEAS